MIGIIGGFLLIALSLLALALQRLYSSVPSRELKRLAQRGDPLAKALYRPVAYGASMRLFLWLILGSALPFGLLLTIPRLPAVAGFVLVAVLVVVALGWVPSMRLTVHSAQFAALLSPAVAWVLSYSNALLSRLAALINRYRELVPHSQLYEKEDLLHLLDLQKEQVDNRILHHELDLTGRALAFDDKHAADIVQPRKAAYVVNADDTIGPVLLDQLHKSGQTSFLVYKDNKDSIIGSVSLRDAVNAKQDGRIFDLIRHDVTFVHEDFSLRQVLTALQSTGQHVVVVINAFEEFVGVITLDRMLQELVGDMEVPVVHSYEDRQAVAAFKPPAEEVVEPKPESPEESPSPEVTEVIQ